VQKAISKGMPLVDCFHAILGKANGAILVSRDRHFQKIEHIVDVGLPEEII